MSTYVNGIPNYFLLLTYVKVFVRIILLCSYFTFFERVFLVAKFAIEGEVVAHKFPLLFQLSRHTVEKGGNNWKTKAEKFQPLKNYFDGSSSRLRRQRKQRVKKIDAFKKFFFPFFPRSLHLESSPEISYFVHSPRVIFKLEKLESSPTYTKWNERPRLLKSNVA